MKNTTSTTYSKAISIYHNLLFTLDNLMPAGLARITAENFLNVKQVSNIIAEEVDSFVFRGVSDECKSAINTLLLLHCQLDESSKPVFECGPNGMKTYSSHNDQLHGLIIQEQEKFPDDKVKIDEAVRGLAKFSATQIIAVELETVNFSEVDGSLTPKVLMALGSLIDYAK